MAPPPFGATVVGLRWPKLFQSARSVKARNHSLNSRTLTVQSDGCQRAKGSHSPINDRAGPTNRARFPGILAGVCGQSPLSPSRHLRIGRSKAGLGLFVRVAITPS